MFASTVGHMIIGACLYQYGSIGTKKRFMPIWLLSAGFSFFGFFVWANPELSRIHFFVLLWIVLTIFVANKQVRDCEGCGKSLFYGDRDYFERKCEECDSDRYP